MKLNQKSNIWVIRLTRFLGVRQRESLSPFLIVLYCLESKGVEGVIAGDLKLCLIVYMLMTHH